jgi:hypothetical protein
MVMLSPQKMLMSAMWGTVACFACDAHACRSPPDPFSRPLSALTPAATPECCGTVVGVKVSAMTTGGKLHLVGCLNEVQPLPYARRSPSLKQVEITTGREPSDQLFAGCCARLLPDQVAAELDSDVLSAEADEVSTASLSRKQLILAAQVASAAEPSTDVEADMLVRLRSRLAALVSDRVFVEGVLLTAVADLADRAREAPDDPASLSEMHLTVLCQAVIRQNADSRPWRCVSEPLPDAVHAVAGLVEGNTALGPSARPALFDSRSFATVAEYVAAERAYDVAAALETFSVAVAAAAARWEGWKTAPWRLVAAHPNALARRTAKKAPSAALQATAVPVGPPDDSGDLSVVLHVVPELVAELFTRWSTDPPARTGPILPAPLAVVESCARDVDPMMFGRLVLDLVDGHGARWEDAVATAAALTGPSSYDSLSFCPSFLQG